MAKKVRQYRWFNGITEKCSKKPNSQEAIDLNFFKDSENFNLENSVGYSIVQLGVQTMPGVRIIVNDSNHPIIVGGTGVFSLANIPDIGITKLAFEESSLNNLDNMDNSYLIVDAIYDE